MWRSPQASVGCEVQACKDMVGRTHLFRVNGILARMNAERVTFGHLYNRASTESSLVLSQAREESDGYKLPQKLVSQTMHAVADGSFKKVQAGHSFSPPPALKPPFGGSSYKLSSLSLTLLFWGSLPDSPEILLAWAGRCLFDESFLSLLLALASSSLAFFS